MILLPSHSALSALIRLLVLVLLVVGCGGQPAALAPASPTMLPTPISPKATAVPPTPSPLPVGQVGDRLEMGGIAITITRVYFLSSVDIPTGPSTMTRFSPREGYTFLIVNAIVENISYPGGVGASYDFKVKASDGIEYSSAFRAPDPQLSGAGLINRGEKGQGNVALEVKKGAAGFVLLFQPVLGQGEPFQQPIEIDLGK